MNRITRIGRKNRKNRKNRTGDDDKHVDIREIETLMKVAIIRQAIEAKAAECKIYFKKDIYEHFKNALKILPFPDRDSIRYYFVLTDTVAAVQGDMSPCWEAHVLDKAGHIPWESILPYEVIAKITAYPVDAEETVRIPGIRHKGNLYDVYFIKYLEDSIIGVVRKIPFRVESRPEFTPASLFDASQFLDLPEKDQANIFLKYFKTYPGLRRKILFDFFVNILPNSREVKEVI
jgi:hypothetical protein